jgi:hypothetical protein
LDKIGQINGQVLQQLQILWSLSFAVAKQIAATVLGVMKFLRNAVEQKFG